MAWPGRSVRIVGVEVFLRSIEVSRAQLRGWKTLTTFPSLFARVVVVEMKLVMLVVVVIVIVVVVVVVVD